MLLAVVITGGVDEGTETRECVCVCVCVVVAEEPGQMLVRRCACEFAYVGVHGCMGASLMFRAADRSTLEVRITRVNNRNDGVRTQT